MRLLLDMNLTPQWIERLAAASLDAVHWADVGARDASDAEIMAFARRHDFVVVTADLDFGDLLAASSEEKPSVIIIRAPDTRPDAVGRHLIAAVRQVEAELSAGALVLVTPARARIRILPLT